MQNSRSFLLILSLVAFTFSSLMVSRAAQAAPENGVVYICSNPSGEIKMTADLESERGQKLAVLAEIGSQALFPELYRNRPQYRFVDRPSKTTLLEVRKVEAPRQVNRRWGARITPKKRWQKEAPASIRLDIVPENTHAIVVQDQGGVKIVRMDAFLTAPSADLTRLPVSCLQTTWK